MINARLVSDLEKLFKKEEYGFGKQEIIVKVSFGSIEVEEFDPSDFETEVEVPKYRTVVVDENGETIDEYDED